MIQHWVINVTQFASFIDFLYKAVPFNVRALLDGRQEGHLACKKLGAGLFVVMI